MTESEREEFIPLVLGMLGKRCSFDPRYKRSSAEDLRLELENSELDERILAAWPGDWPGRQVVDLDNVGDAGAWLSEKLEGEPLAQTLFGWNWDDEANAAMLAEEYLRAIIEAGHFPPSYYGDEASAGDDGWTEEDEKLVQAEFVAFFRHWRERIVATIEKQNPPTSGD
jgi:hypothetical protein